MHWPQVQTAVPALLESVLRECIAQADRFDPPSMARLVHGYAMLQLRPPGLLGPLCRCGGGWQTAGVQGWHGMAWSSRVVCLCVGIQKLVPKACALMPLCLPLRTRGFQFGHSTSSL